MYRRVLFKSNALQCSEIQSKALLPEDSCDHEEACRTRPSKAGQEVKRPSQPFGLRHLPCNGRPALFGHWAATRGAVLINECSTWE